MSQHEATKETAAPQKEGPAERGAPASVAHPAVAGAWNTYVGALRGGGTVQRREVEQGQTTKPIRALGSEAGREAVQRKKKPKKGISSKAMKRIVKAREAIAHVKGVMAFGAGNQYGALSASNFNTAFRTQCMRDKDCWIVAPSVRPIAAANPAAFTAAKADLAKSGNCGEHAIVALDHLGVIATGEKCNLSNVTGLDHAFVLIGDVPGEADADLTVCDPWPSSATACTWEDHFAYTPDKAQINVQRSITADGKSAKAVIAAGLKLSPKGEAMIQAKLSDKQTKEELEKGTDSSAGKHPWIWSHPNAAASGKDYEYEEAKP